MFDIFFVQQPVNGLLGRFHLRADGHRLYADFRRAQCGQLRAWRDLYDRFVRRGWLAITYFAPPLFVVILIALAIGALAGFSLERIAFKPFSPLSATRPR